MATAEPFAALPEDLTGRTVLDVGCGYGIVAREAARRGASRVVAIDIDDERLAFARGVAGLYNNTIEYRSGDVEIGLPAGRFDHVVCHNLIHRVRNPIDVLDRLIASAGTSLVLEVTGLGDERPQRLLRRDYGALEPLRDLLQEMPLALIGRNGTPPRKREQKFFFSPGAMHNLLMEQRRYFSALDVVASGAAGRYLVRAVRREIGHLVIVSGPTGSGKSTFLDRVSHGHPTVRFAAEAAGIRHAADYAVANGDGLAVLASREPKLLFHYDLLRPWRRDAGIHQRDEVLHVVDCCRRLTVITLVARPSALCRRLEAELDGLADSGSRSGRRLQEVLHLYSDTNRLVDRVAAWIDFCRGRGAELRFIDTSDGYCALTESRWREIIEDD